jgi:hypothetical protein
LMTLAKYARLVSGIRPLAKLELIRVVVSPE